MAAGRLAISREMKLWTEKYYTQAHTSLTGVIFPQHILRFNYPSFYLVFPAFPKTINYGTGLLFTGCLKKLYNKKSNLPK
jgi:hypothetical protein